MIFGQTMPGLWPRRFYSFSSAPTALVMQTTAFDKVAGLLTAEASAPTVPSTPSTVEAPPTVPARLVSELSQLPSAGATAGNSDAEKVRWLTAHLTASTASSMCLV